VCVRKRESTNTHAPKQKTTTKKTNSSIRTDCEDGGHPDDLLGEHTQQRQEGVRKDQRRADEAAADSLNGSVTVRE
jgi:TATA-binding protein-associated factor Taf7